MDFNLIVVETDLSRPMARSLEQVLIMSFTLDALENKINAIAEGRYDDFVEELDRARTLILKW